MSSAEKVRARGELPRGELSAAGAAVPGSPAASRLRGPRWRDGRLVAGVLLVLVAVLVGARVVGAAQRTTAVLTAARDLPVGHPLAPGDLVVAHVRLAAAGQRYWPAADLTGLTGHPLTAAVGGGDLLPRSVVGADAAPQPTRVVSVPVDPTRLPTLAAGDLVDVFATPRAAATTGVLPATVTVLRGAEYLGGDGNASGSSVAVRLRVPVTATAALVRASELDALDIALQQPAGDTAGDVGPGSYGPLTASASSVATAAP